MSEPPATPSYGELAALVVAQAGVIESLRVEVGELRTEVAALRRQVGRDSSNSSQPPSKDDPGATAKAKADKRSGEQTAAGRAPKRGQGGQKGHRGSGLQRVAVPDRTQRLEPPACGGCGGDLAGAPGRIASSVQVFDLPTFSLLVTEYLMMRRVCGCGHVTTADLPAGVRGGPTCYGPQRDRGGHAVGLGRCDRDRAGRGPDVRAARRHGVHRLRLLLPGPPGHSADHAPGSRTP